MTVAYPLFYVHEIGPPSEKGELTYALYTDAVFGVRWTAADADESEPLAWFLVDGEAGFLVREVGDYTACLADEPDAGECVPGCLRLAERERPR